MNQTNTHRFHYLSRSNLIKAAELSIRNDFNRQLEIEAIKNLPMDRVLISMMFPHHHRRFVPCDEHMRLVLDLPIDANDLQKGFAVAVVDVPLHFLGRIKTLDLPA